VDDPQWGASHGQEADVTRLSIKAIVGWSVTVLGLAVLSACGSTRAPSGLTSRAPTATATPVLSATYTSADGVYRIGYPGSWEAQPVANSSVQGAVTIASQDKQTIMLITPYPGTASASYPTILATGLKNAKWTNVHVDTTTKTLTLPSGTWTVATGTFELSGGQGAAILYGTVHNDTTFILLGLGHASSASSDQTTYFTPMLTSFRFLK
jgi:hypothetical protein